MSPAQPLPFKAVGRVPSSDTGLMAINFAAKLSRKVAEKKRLGRRQSVIALAMPLPDVGVSMTFDEKPPDDANLAERARDYVLTCFGNPNAQLTFGILAVLVALCVVGFGVLAAFCFLGLFFGVSNGWDGLSEVCAAALVPGESLPAMSVPKVNGSFVADYCTENQLRFNVMVALNPRATLCGVGWGLASAGVEQELEGWGAACCAACCTEVFLSRAASGSLCAVQSIRRPTPPLHLWPQMCVKAFVSLFSYINFLPIPWRLAILHHATCSRRRTGAGYDFYGRPTDSLWFNIPSWEQRRIAVALNLGWVLHFLCLAFHLAYWSFIQGQVLPGAVLQNVTFISSILCVVLAACWQSRAEAGVMRAFPDRRGIPPPYPLRARSHSPISLALPGTLRG